jgi:hypothetical protein
MRCITGPGDQTRRNHAPDLLKNLVLRGGRGPPLILSLCDSGLKARKMIDFERTTWRSDLVWFMAALLAMSIISTVTLNMFPG